MAWQFLTCGVDAVIPDTHERYVELDCLGLAVGGLRRADGNLREDRNSECRSRFCDVFCARSSWCSISGLFVVMTGKWSNPAELSRQTWLFLTLSAFATAASWMCYFRALQMGPASQVAPIDKLSLVLVAVFAYAFLGERPTLRDWCGIGLVAVGVVECRSNGESIAAVYTVAGCSVGCAQDTMRIAAANVQSIRRENG